MNAQRFDPLSNVEKWGVIEHWKAYLYPQAFTELCQGGGFSRKSFSAWAIRKGLIEPDSQGKPPSRRRWMVKTGGVFVFIWRAHRRRMRMVLCLWKTVRRHFRLTEKGNTVTPETPKNSKYI